MKPKQQRNEKKGGGGRPPKFGEPSRPITLTLPESTLRALEHIDGDRGQAIVKLANQALRGEKGTAPLVEIVKMKAETGLVVVGPSTILRQIPFLHLVEVAPARYLVALDSNHDFQSLEIAINDLLEDVPLNEQREKELVVELLDHIKRARKAERVSVAQILFVRLDGKGRR